MIRFLVLSAAALLSSNVLAYPAGSCQDRVALTAFFAIARDNGVTKSEYVRRLVNVFETGDFQVSLVDRAEILRLVDLVFDRGMNSKDIYPDCNGPKVRS